MKRGSLLKSPTRWLRAQMKGNGNAVPVLGDYEYAPLQLSSSEIRIFEILPGINGEYVHGKLVSMPLEEAANNYTALSYCWGSSAKTDTIYGDGRRLMVTSNLHSALRRLRKLGYSAIWADAICINQSDDVEKGAQVQAMGQIYKHAERVICDLGGADGDPRSALDSLHTIIASLNALTRLEPLGVQDFEKHSLPAVHHEQWRVLGKLLRLSWFRRLWVKQELALAKSAHMLWGLTCFDWDFLSQAIKSIDRLQIFDILHHEGVIERGDLSTVNQINNMEFLRYNVRENAQLRLGDMVYLTQLAEVTDPRDKIYSVLGLTIDASDPALYASYSESTSTVSNRVSRRLIEKYGMDQQDGIKLLSYSSGPREGSPSWAIDWNKDMAKVYTSFSGYNWYDTTKGTLPKFRLKEDNSLVVVVAGSKFDTIARVNSARIQSPKYSWDGFCKWDVEARTLIDDLPAYPTAEPIIHAYVRTLAADSYSHPKLDGSTLADSYTAYITPFSHDDDEARETELQRLGDPFRIRTKALGNRRFCVTRRGYFGLVPPGAQVGDIVCLLLGGKAPVVLRRDESDGLYIYMGDCYVHGIMYGEALKHDDFYVEDFLIK
jgi:hypothetical protein